MRGHLAVYSAVAQVLILIYAAISRTKFTICLSSEFRLELVVTATIVIFYVWKRCGKA
jgi:hypothetical protein